MILKYALIVTTIVISLSLLCRVQCDYIDDDTTIDDEDDSIGFDNIPAPSTAPHSYYTQQVAHKNDRYVT